MAITEVFPNPTVKQVAFEIKFPNLFFIESKIGDLQIKIMNKFPESALIFQRGLLVAINPEKIEELQQKVPHEQGTKMWQFTNPPLGYTLNVTSNTLAITSTSHKTYNNQQSDNRFRDIISSVLKPFLELTNLTTLNRVGLRYIDECPFVEQTTTSFLAHFNSCLSTARFSIENSVEHQYIAFVKRDEYFLRYVETYNTQVKPTTLVLDFDASANNIQSTTCLDVTDKLHIVIANEYEATIKKPIYDYMRGGEKDAVGGKNV